MLATDNAEELPAPLNALREQFQGWCDSDLAAKSPANYDGTLYHYTNAQGLLGIIERSELWFTHHAHLNDPTEFQFGLDVFKHVVREEADRIAADNPLGKTLCEIVLDLCRPENLESLGYYVVSLSISEDDLEQWRLYGDNGRGFALGLKQSLFKPTAEPGPAEQRFVMLDVVYGEAEGANHFRSWVIEAANIVGRVAPAMGSRQVLLHFLREIANLLLAGLIPLCLTVKHSAYAHEKEVRLGLFEVRGFSEPVVEFRARGSNVVPFVRVSMPTLRQHIASVHLGPSADATGRDALRALFRKYQITAPVTQSVLPYRSF